MDMVYYEGKGKEITKRNRKSAAKQGVLQRFLRSIFSNYKAAKAFS